MNVCRFFRVASLIIVTFPGAALAKDCNDIKTDIDAKLKAKGVTNYALHIVDGREVNEGQIVGNCASGAKRIVYFKEPANKNALVEALTASPKQAPPVSSTSATSTPIVTGPAR